MTKRRPLAFAGTGWTVTRSGDGPMADVHVIPRNDQAPHVLTRKCVCGPRIEETALRTIVVHAAADKREHFEQLKIM